MAHWAGQVGPTQTVTVPVLVPVVVPVAPPCPPLDAERPCPDEQLEAAKVSPPTTAVRSPKSQTRDQRPGVWGYPPS